MDKRIEQLIEFVEKYGVDFLEDGTKKNIINELKNENTSLFSELVECMNNEWIDRVKEINKFYVFTDCKKVLMNDKKENSEPYYKAGYIDSVQDKMNKIPIIRKVIIRELYKDYNDVQI